MAMEMQMGDDADADTRYAKRDEMLKTERLKREGKGERENEKHKKGETGKRLNG